MAFNLTRMTVYALISAIEEDLRDIVKAHVKDKGSFSSGLTEKCLNRIDKDIGALFGDITPEEMVDYFDLGDTYQTINTGTETFPTHIIRAIQKLTKDFEELVPIRNRVMHIRPLNFDDYSKVAIICEKLLSSNELSWEKLKNITAKISEDTSFLLGIDIKNYDEPSLVSHNLPMPDFDETGLIGRDNEIKKIKKLCLGSFPVISIVGEGGVGKSALALKVA